MSEIKIYKSKETYNYNGTDVSIIKAQYYNTESAALILVDANDYDSTVLTATVNVGEETGLSAAYIKDYSENAGVEQWLIQNGIIEPKALDIHYSGFVAMTKHNINTDAFEIYETITN